MLEDPAGKLDKRTVEQLRKMRAASERMAAVFDGLQMLFRLTSGEIRREAVDVSALSAEIVQELRATNPKRKVDADIAPGIAVNGDQLDVTAYHDETNLPIRYTIKAGEYGALGPLWVRYESQRQAT